MKESPKHILLKLSGEALGENGRLFDQDMILRVGRILSDVAATGAQLGVVIGAGNIWRGRQSQEMDAVTADHMGMLGTVINCLCMRDAVERTGGHAVVFSAIDMPRVCEPYNVQSAIPPWFCAPPNCRPLCCCWPRMWMACTRPTPIRTPTPS